MVVDDEDDNLEIQKEVDIEKLYQPDRKPNRDKDPIDNVEAVVDGAKNVKDHLKLNEKTEDVIEIEKEENNRTNVVVEDKNDHDD